MTNAKLTKRALLSSAVALILCFSMLLGTTYAWFTDSVTSANNVIKSGNLDIDVEYTLDGENWKDLNGAEDLFQKGLWEPGHTEVVALRITNKGSLALNYAVNMNLVNEVVGKTKDGADIVLSNILTVSTLTIEDAGVDPVLGMNIAAMTLEKAFESEDAIAWNAPSSFKDANALEAGSNLYVGSTQYVFVKVDMDKDVGNEANHDGENVPSIEFGINVLATQFTYENDSFGNQYDKNAWTEVAEVPTPDANGVVDVYSAQQLAGVMKNFTDVKVINIKEDIDLNGRYWVPSFVTAPGLVINGNGHTISNMTTSGASNVGFIGAAYQDITIKDLTFKNATVEATGSFVGIVIGNGWGGNAITLDNVDVIDSEASTSVPTKAIRIGALIGYSPYTRGDLTIKNCDVTGSTITGYHNVGAMVGTMMFYGPEQGTITIENSTAKNNTLRYGSPNVGAFAFGASTSGYTEYVPASGFTAENNKLVAIATDANTLKSALIANEKNINITLGADVELPISSLGSITGGSGEYKLGGADTETIIIDLNGHKLDIATTYWSALGAVNADATITIKNGSMTSTGNSAGTWNAWDLRFSNCNWNFENVNFGKAVALDNAGKVTNMTTVTITDSHNTDTYALWITAEGQEVNIDGLTIDMLDATDGRGIKIDNQYVAAADEAVVTLNIKNATFKTEEKSAILVKSTAGADITLENVNISGVEADTTNAVWNDSATAAYFDNVTVTGGTIKQEQ